ncbi:MAG: CBS domain-containing protein [Gammaproteobacteria bacterium]|nr:CBS domain-containing protein [Gammaproteobacteria bacterium]
MRLVSHLLIDKGVDVVTTTPNTSVRDAIKVMAERSIGALLVMDGESLAGIITERDYARKVILKGRSSADTPVRDIMTAKVYSASRRNTVNECMHMMTEHRIRHLPVVELGKVIGIISIGDLVKAIIADQQEEIAQLAQYITG